LSLENFDHELQIACRGIGMLLGSAICAYLLLAGLPQTLMSGLYDVFAIVTVVALTLAISRKSLICTAGLLMLIGYDAFLHLIEDPEPLGMIFDIGLLYFLFRALRVVIAKRAPAASAQ
jgi:hypothetical protein